MSRKIQRILVIAGIFVFAIGGASIMSSMKPEPPKKEKDIKAMLVDVMTLEAMTEKFQVRSQGTVRPRTETVLSAEVSGTIQSISPKFVAGGVFGEGEVLMRIDPTNYLVAVEKANALVKQRQIEYDGAKKLRSQGYRAEAELAAADAALASAKAELVRAKRDLERTYIKLPYAGMVRSKDTDIGQFVNPGTRLGITFATDFAEVRLPLTDQDLAFIDLPDPVEITASGWTRGPVVELGAVQKGKLTTWHARISRTEGVVDENSRVTYAVARVEDPYSLQGDHEPLPMGSFVAAKISGTEVESVIRVPRSALRGSNELLFVDSENKVHVRAVGLIRADAEFAYVSEGASPGERISITPIEAPIDGMSVRTSDDPEIDPDDEVEETSVASTGDGEQE